MSSLQFGGVVNSLENEVQILDRLLYRNKNQHGKTKLFTQLKAISSELKCLTCERMRSLNDSLERCVRLATAQQKISHVDLSEVMSTYEITSKALAKCVTAANWCSFAFKTLAEQLTLKVFVPLYTLLLALVARMMHCLVSVTIHFEVRFQTLTVQTKHIGAMQSRFSDRISAVLTSSALSAYHAKLIASLKSTHSSDIRGAESSARNNINSNSSSSSSSSGIAAHSGHHGGEDVGDVVGDGASLADISATEAVDCVLSVEVNSTMKIDSWEAMRGVSPSSTVPCSHSSSSKKRKTEVEEIEASTGTGGRSDDGLLDPSLFESAAVIDQVPVPVTEGGSGGGWVKKNKTKSRDQKRRRLLQQQQQLGGEGGEGVTTGAMDAIDDIFGGIV